MQLENEVGDFGEALTWQFPAAKVIQAVQDHQATTKPKNLAYFGPALSAAQMYILPLRGRAEHISASTAAVIHMKTIVIR